MPAQQPVLEAVPRREVHLRDYLRVIVKRKMTIITFLVITLLTVIIVTFSSTPLYTASSEVLIEKNYGSNNLQGNRPVVYYDPDFLTTQFEIIRSANVAHKVVKRLHLDTKYKKYFLEEQEDNFSSLIVSLKHKISSFLTHIFNRSSRKIEMKPGTMVDGLPVAKEALTDADIIASMIQQNLSIEPIAKTKTVYIVYTNKYPFIAKLVADEIVRAYKDEILQMKLSSSNYALQWMTSKANEERKKLEESEKALQKYMREHDLVTVENKLAVFPQKLAEFSKQLSDAQAEQKEYEALYDQIKATGKDYKDIETIPVFADNKVLQDLRDKIYTADQKIKELSKKYGPKHPKMIQAMSERALLLKEKRFEVDRIIAATKNSYALAKSRENNLKKLLAQTKADLLDMNERFMQYTIMKREVDMNRVLYDNLTSSIKTANVTEQSQDVNIWVIKKAEFPIYPSKPKKKRNLLLGLILGTFGGVGLAFFLEYLDNTVKTSEEIEEHFNLTVLGSVEEVKDKEGAVESSLVHSPLSPLAESYRLIRSALLLSSPGRAPRVILVTSMAPKEGKTVTTANLARILAESDKKVLIIDCDMRRPRMHSLFGLSSSHGLSNYLAGDTGQSLVQDIAEENLYLIPSGPIPPNPSELLNTSGMKRLVADMLESFDFILLDSPPVQSVTDSLALSSFADGTILVVRAGRTTYDVLDDGIKKLYEINTHILGFVLNGVNPLDGGSGYYNDDYYTENS